MEINRRTFVTGAAFAGGAGMGLMLTPAPWYLLRDAAFWTQNWSWVPTPKPGQSTSDNSICRMCGSACGIKVRKVGARLVTVNGNQEHPVTKGSMCPIGFASLQMLYGPARVKSPMRRAGGRESSTWESVSWETALRQIAEKIKLLRSSQKSHAIACISTNERTTTNELLERLLEAIGSPNFIKMNAGMDAQNIVHSLMQGGDAAAFDIEHSRCILSFGCSLFEGWGALGRMYQAQARWTTGAEEERPDIIQIEPNLSVTANHASHWVPIQSGTEAVLALGIAHVLIRDGLYDRAYVNRHCFGFSDWQDSAGKTHVGFESVVRAKYPPQVVETITKVPAREIEELAHRFSSHRPALAVGGGGRGDRIANLYGLMAIHSLNALVGNINQPGGLMDQALPPIKPLSPIKKDAEAERGLSIARCDGAGTKYPLAVSSPHNIDPDQIEMLLLHEVNPYYSLPDQQHARRLFGKVPFIVSISSYMDESASRADLVLPLSTPFERWDDLAGIPGVPNATYSLSCPLIDPLYDTRAGGDITIQLANAVGGGIGENFPWNTTAEILRLKAEQIYAANRGRVNGATDDDTSSGKLQQRYPAFPAFWAGLVENGCWHDPALTHDESRSLKTPSGKFEFYSRTLSDKFGFSSDLKCMPHYLETALPPEGFDLILMPEEMVTVASGGLGTPPLLIKQLSDTVLLKDELFVRINPVTAMFRGLKDGDQVILESTRGRVRVRIYISAGVREGVVLIPLGFGHTAYDQFLRNKGVNACQLLEESSDPLSGLQCCCGTPGKMRKA